MRIDIITQNASIASSFLPVIAGAIAIKKGLFFKKFIPLYCFFVFTVFFEFYPNIFSVQEINNAWRMHAFTIIEFLVFAWVIRSYIKSDSKKQIILISLPLYMVFWIISHIYFESIYEFDNISATTANLLFLIFSFMLLHETFTDYNSLTPVRAQRRYWLGGGVFLYAIGASLILGFSNVLYKNLTNEQVSFVWIIHDVLVITVNCFFVKSFLCKH